MTGLPKFFFCMGTAGELIKVYPLIKKAEEANIAWHVLVTGQSCQNFWSQWDAFGLNKSNTTQVIKTNNDLADSKQALLWFFKATIFGSARIKKALMNKNLIKKGDQSIVVVHGDTLSTLVGAIWGKCLGAKVAHVEAGLRSSSLLSPFPEEISRRMVSRLAEVHFCQDETALSNIKKSGRGGYAINTQGNTLYDSIQYVIKYFPSPADMPAGDYVLVNIHRFENLNSDVRWKFICDVLVKVAKSRSLYMVMHPGTASKISSSKEGKILKEAGVRFMNRKSYTEFLHYLNNCEFIISDGGSNQEECYYLGKPCLVMRSHTEREEGLDSGVCVLSYFNKRNVDEFLSNVEKVNYFSPVGFEFTPSEKILETLQDKKYA